MVVNNGRGSAPYRFWGAAAMRVQSPWTWKGQQRQRQRPRLSCEQESWSILYKVICPMRWNSKLCSFPVDLWFFLEGFTPINAKPPQDENSSLDRPIQTKNEGFKLRNLPVAWYFVSDVGLGSVFVCLCGYFVKFSEKRTYGVPCASYDTIIFCFHNELVN